MIDVSVILYLLVGAALGAVVCFLIAKLKAQKAASDQDGIAKANAERLTDKERELAALKERLDKAEIALRLQNDTAQKRQDELSEQLRAAESARARLEGAGESLVALKEQLAAKDEELQGYLQRITQLSSDLSQARSNAENANRIKTELLEQKEAAVLTQLKAKDDECMKIVAERTEALAVQRKDLEDSLRAQIAEKDRAIEDQKRLLQDAEKVLTEKFSSVSMESLKQATEEFLKLAGQTFEKTTELAKGDLEKRQQSIDEMLKPVKETLEKMDRQNQEMEQKRVSAFDQIVKGIETLSTEADQLANALRKPQARGAWGEMQLQKILENSGLVEGEHFELQHSTEGEEGRQRTDVIIKLPKDRLIVIDSKAPLDSYWDGMNATDETTRQAKFSHHAKRVREHVKQLSGKAYWDRYKGAPDCAVMFIATEGAYQAAIEADPALITDAHQSRIYIANPMTVISMVHIAAYVLREEKLREDAYKVQEVGAELYDRLRVFARHFSAIGRNLDITVRDYNQAVGSLDGRVIQQARKMRQLGAGKGEEIVNPKIVESAVRPITNTDLRELPPLAIVDGDAPALNGHSDRTETD
jgi:DNA recombination protein RmuC